MGDRQRTILVVDDDALIRDIVRTILDLENFEVRLAEDGEQALAAVAEQAPDVLVLDVMMPGITGYEVCRTLKDDPATAGLPIILLTARDQPEDRRAGADAGCDAYLAKPFSPLELIDVIEKLTVGAA